MWKFKLPTEIVYGEGEARSLGALLSERGLRKAVLLTSPGFVARGEAARIVRESQGAIIGTASDIEPNPTVENVTSCVSIARSLGAECLVAVGGGSVMDCAKAVGVVLHDGVASEALLSGHKVSGMLPLVAVPTTAGTASETTGVSVLSWKAKNLKTAVISPALYPTLAVVDPLLTHSCPPALTASSGVDVLAHALDSLGSVRSSPVSAPLAVEAARLAFGNLRACYRHGSDAAAREALARASLLAGMAFSQSGTSGAHACSYVLTVKYGMPHGEACAFTLDSWYRINAVARPELDSYARGMGFASAEALAGELNRLKADLGLKSRLSAAGIGLADLPKIAEESLAAGAMRNNVVQLTKEELIALFREKA